MRAELGYEPENVQIYAVRRRIVPNDVIAKKLFSLSLDVFRKLRVGAIGTVAEKRNHKRYGTINSEMQISVNEPSEPLDQYDYAVMSACVSAWYAGQSYTTPSVIYRSLTGKVGKDQTPSSMQIAQVMESVMKLMRIQVKLDLSEVCARFGYNGGRALKLVSQILPCKLLMSTRANGADATVIQFLAESPLLTVAQLKNDQLLSYDVTLLDVPRMQNTVMNISLKNYVMNRVQEIKLHKMTPVLTYEDVFGKCKVGSNRDARMNARKVMDRFMGHLAMKAEIKGYEVLKSGNSYRGLSFEY